MAIDRTRQDDGPDIWAIAAGWLALVIGVITLNLWAWHWTWGEPWVLRGAIITGALFLTWLFGYWSRIVTTVRHWTRRGGLNATAVVIGVLIAAVGVNYMLHRYHWQWDLTKNKRFTLADRTQQILKGLKEPVQATAFYYEVGSNRRQAENLLRQYADVTDKFKFRMVDPLANPQLVQDKKLQTEQGVVFEYQGRTQQASQVGEKEWTTALLQLTRDKQPKVLFLQGHGEMAFEGGMGMGDATRSLSEVVTRLRGDQWQVEALNLRGKDVKAPDPKAAGVIVIAAPTLPLAKEEEQRLNEYLANGGRILALTQPGGPDLSGILKPYGIEAVNNYLYEPRSENGMLVVQQMESHDLMRRLAVLLFLNVRQVKPLDQPPMGITAQSLVKTPAEVLASTKPLRRLDPNSKDLKAGAYSVAAVGTKAGAEGKPESRVVAIGSGLSFSDAFMQALGPSSHNANFFTNAVNWLGDQTELVSIEPKDTAPKSLSVLPQHSRLLMFIYWLEFPLLAVLLGIYIYLKRR